MSAIAATFSDLKVVKSRSVGQLVLEVPIEKLDEALTILGGVPKPGNEVWVGVARLAATPEPKAPKSEPTRQRFVDLPPSQQAALKCADADFQRFLADAYPTAWQDGRSAHPNAGTGAELTAAAVVRWKCGVGSRSALNMDKTAAAKWAALMTKYEDHQFQKRYAQ